MAVLEALKPFFDGMNAMIGTKDERPPAEAREAWYKLSATNFAPFLAPTEPLPSEVDHKIPVDGVEIAVRVYSPTPTGSPLPCHIYIHGGGFWMGTLEQSDQACRSLANDVDCVVVSVEYRLAPEHKFPAAPEDCYSALLWVAAHASELGVDLSRISVGGPSAGGNLAAVVALMARDRNGPSLVFQVVEIPLTDFTMMEPLEIPAENLTLPTGKERYGEYYFKDQSDATNPYASPLLASDLSGLPPALVTSVEYDSLEREAKAFAAKLVDAGVATDYKCWKGHFHGSFTLFGLIPEEAAAYHHQIVDALRRAYGTSQLVSP